MSLYSSWKGLQGRSVKPTVSKTSPCYSPVLGHQPPFQSSGLLSTFFCPQKPPDAAQPWVAQWTQARDLESRSHAFAHSNCAANQLGFVQGITLRKDTAQWVQGAGQCFLWAFSWHMGKAFPVESTLCGSAGNLWMRGWLSEGAIVSCGMLVNGDTMGQGT